MASFSILTIKDTSKCPNCDYRKCKVHPSVSSIIIDWVEHFHQRPAREIIHDFRKTLDGGFVFGHRNSYNFFNRDLLGGFDDEQLDNQFTRDTSYRLYLPDLPMKNIYCTKCAKKLKEI